MCITYVRNPSMMSALRAVRILCPSRLRITIETHEAALKIAEKYGYGIYDALVIATALEGECRTLYSEDLRDGQTVDGQVTIRNPFARSRGHRNYGTDAAPSKRARAMEWMKRTTRLRIAES